MKNWKKTSLLAAMLLSLALAGCNKEEEPASIDEIVENVKPTAVKVEADIERATEIKKYAQNAVGEFEKILYRKDFKSQDINKQIIDSHIKKVETADNFFAYTQQYIPYGMNIKKITFNKNTEELYEQNGRYFYQVTAEAQYVRSGFLGIEGFSYFLMINQSKEGQYFIEDIRWEKGHLLDGYELLSERGEDNVTKEKLEIFVKNALSLETSIKETAIQNVSSVFRTEEEARIFLDKIQFNSNDKRILEDFIYDDGSFEVSQELFEGNEDLSLVGKGKFGFSYKNESGLIKKEAYVFKIILSQRYPANDDYVYVIDDITLTKTNEFPWE